MKYAGSGRVMSKSVFALALLELAVETRRDETSGRKVAPFFSSLFSFPFLFFHSFLYVFFLFPFKSWTHGRQSCP